MGWRAVSQRRLEEEWARLSNSGMLIWEDVVRREKAWQQNWITPAMEAWHNRQMGHIEGDEEDAVVIDRDRDHPAVRVDEDDVLFAPEHEYIEKPLTVLNKKFDSTTTSTNVAASDAIIGDMKAAAPPRRKKR